MKIETKPLVIGQHVNTHLYGYGRCVIFGIHGKSLSESAKSRGKQEKNDIQDAFSFEVKKLKTLPEFFHLKMIDSNNASVAVVVSSNIRLLLNKHFPTVKFSVKKTSYNSVSVRWEDGPRCEQVEEITSKLKSGYFNSMEDVYEYSESPFNAVYGGVNYVTLDRHYSDELIEKALTECRETFGNEVPVWADVESYKKGELFNVNLGSLFNDNLQSEIRLKLKSL